MLDIHQHTNFSYDFLKIGKQEYCIHHRVADAVYKWRPQGGSNPRYRRERAVS